MERRMGTAVGPMVGLVGVGRMGRGILKNLLKRGHAVSAYDTEPEPREEAARLGARVAGSWGDAGRGSQVVFLSLPGPKEAHSVVCGPGGLVESMGRGGLIIDTTTGDPETARRASHDAAARGITCLDAPVSGGASAAEQGSLTVMVGGAPADFERALPFLQCIGHQIFHVGATGAGHALKLCHQLLVYNSLAALCEALTVGAQMGLDPDVATHVFSKSSASSQIITTFGPKLVARAFDQVSFPVRLALKDQTLFLGMAQKAGTPAPLGTAVETFFRAAVAQGYGDLDMSAVLQVFEQLAGRSHHRHDAPS
jgi:3-hydroxyisobutyrate dehydrogenase-like beta-hydroxyacid dehydrogenase